MTRTIVVGIDGSESSMGALRWAQQAASGDAVVKLVAGWTYAIDPVSSIDGIPGPGVPIDLLEEMAQRVLDDVEHAVPADGVRRESEVSVGVSDAAALLDAAEGADLLVVGARPHSAMERVLGTVAIQCAQYAPCPYVAVPESAPPLAGAVTVAYDGSDASRAALRWAAETTERLGLGLRVVTVWERHGAPGGLHVADDAIASTDRALDELRAAVDEVVPGLSERAELHPVEASRKVAATLVEAAEGTTALVMGSRGRGGFRGLVLGSVSQRCLEISPIPVVIVRD